MAEADWSDPIDDRLRGLARDTEPLVVLAGPETARRQGERRRARRRAAAGALVAALALGLGSWQLLPRLGTQPKDFPPAATTPVPAPDSLAARLARELLPVTALPNDPKWPWAAVPDTARGAFHSPCAVSAMHDVRARADRTYYDAPDELVAHYYLYAFTDAATAAAQADHMTELFKAKCALTVAAPYDGRAIPGRVMYRGLGGAQPATSVTMNRLGPYLAVFTVSSAGNHAAGKSDSASKDPWPDLCITRSLHRLDPAAGGAAPDLNATPPDSADRTRHGASPPAGSTTGGSGTGHPPGPDMKAGGALPTVPPTVPPTDPPADPPADRC